ncbi:hypothetical protein E2562_031036 [Oryza meyeriana var. granulata]|uniref:Uncharacterized protein n=1 Tax=Oryza meyeriana var. granulata TaxID=110450 RepID=A0A6G1FE80_9ORYZ|nr:hypothetical protein E2562_031036 [Oryza meyeriana var. granulata]
MWEKLCRSHVFHCPIYDFFIEESNVAHGLYMAVNHDNPSPSPVKLLASLSQVLVHGMNHVNKAQKLSVEYPWHGI